VNGVLESSSNMSSRLDEKSFVKKGPSRVDKTAKSGSFREPENLLLCSRKHRSRDYLDSNRLRGLLFGFDQISRGAAPEFKTSTLSRSIERRKKTSAEPCKNAELRIKFIRSGLLLAVAHGCAVREELWSVCASA
jgi:hypothetical protein